MRKSEAITNLIERALLFDNERQRQKRVDSKGGDARKLNPYATDLGACERKVWYSLRGYQESNPPDLQSLANFLFGHAAEDAYARILGQLPEPESMKIIQEVRLQVGNTSGRADFLIWDPNLRCIVELKSTKGYQVKFLPNENHVKQLRFYMHAGKLGLLEEYGIHPDDCDSAVLCYIRKDATRGTKTFLPFDVLYDERAIMLALDANDRVFEKSHTDMDPPPRPKGYVQTKFPCGDKNGKAWCPYFATCWGHTWRQEG